MSSLFREGKAEVSKQQQLFFSFSVANPVTSVVAIIGSDNVDVSVIADLHEQAKQQPL